MNYYNEYDPFAAAWLCKLIEAGLIPAGDVDDRSITEVKAHELKGYTQCHFFAGIGGWSYALQLAGWPTDRPVWTGSCPCQPFSSAGKQKGKEDERHLWPVWFELIRQSRPPIVFGEQVSSAIRHGWWDDVADDMEGEGYTTRAEIRPACSVGAPHKRERLWFVAHAASTQCLSGTEVLGALPRVPQDRQEFDNANGRGAPCNVANSESEQAQRQRSCGFQPVFAQLGAGDVADTIGTGSQGHGQPREQSIQEMRQGAERYSWEDSIWSDCPDGKQRLIEPSIPLLAHGVSNRVGRLRGYGNAIVPQVAAEFIVSYKKTLPHHPERSRV